MIKGFEDNPSITIEDVINKFGKIGGKTDIACACDRCKKEFVKQWRSLRAEINTNLCNNCVQARRFESFSERQRQSSAMKLHYKEPKNREKISNGLNDYYSTCADSRLKLSIAAKKRFEDPLEREKVSKNVKKRFEDIEERRKISIAQIDRYKNPEVVKKNSDAIKLAWKNPEYRKRHRRALKEYFSNPDARKKSSEIHKLLWQNEEYRTKMLPIVSKNRIVSGVLNKKEAKILSMLKTYNFEFTGGGASALQIAGFYPDFVNIDKKLIIEFNGCHWHKCRQCYPDKFNGQSFTSRDLAKLHAYPREGFRVLFIWEHELRSNAKKLKQKIESFIKDPNYPTKLQD